MGNPFAWFELRSKDVATSQKFYEGLMGWPIQQVPGPDGTEMNLVGGKTPWAGIASSDSDTGWLPYLEVEDVESATKQAVELGARVLRPIVQGPAGRYATIEDPAGSEIALWQPA